MNRNKSTPAKPGVTPDEGQVQRLLEGLYEQRSELGEIANDLVQLLLDAGVPLPSHLLRPDRRDDPPR